MTEILYKLVYIVAKFHSYFMSLNDSYELYFSDKELHFWIIGALGIAMIIAIYPIFRFLAKREHYLTLTWIYVFTMIIVITFAIEIGQKITNTGNMEFSDIVFGVTGFLVLYLGLVVIIETLKLIGKIFKMIAKNIFNYEENDNNQEQ